MMKKFALFLCCILICLSATACHKEDTANTESAASAQQQTVPPDPTQPDGAIVELLEGAKNWDTEVFSPYLPDNFSLDAQIPAQFQQIIADAFERMDYRIIHTQTDGDTAAVEVEITAVEAKSAASDAVSAATSYAVKQQLAQSEIEIPELVDRVVDSMDIPSLPTQTSTCTVYMVKQADGTWQPDTTDERNFSFLDAASGGSMELVSNVMKLADQYGFVLQ